MRAVAVGSAPPRLKASLSFRPEGGATLLVDPDGHTVATLQGPEVALAAIMDGETDEGELLETARTLGVEREEAVRSLIDRLWAAGCLEAGRDTGGTGLVPVTEESMRRAIILAGRGIDGPARQLLLEIEQVDPGRPEVRDLLAVLDAEREEGLAESEVTREEILQAENEAAVVLPKPGPSLTYRPKQAPSQLGKTARRRLTRVAVVGGVLGILALIPARGTVYAPAALRPVVAEPVRAPLGGATITTVLARDGDLVRRGQIVVQLMDMPARAGVALAETTLAARMADLQAAERGAQAADVGEARAEAQARAQDLARVGAECANTRRLVQQGVMARADLDACERRRAAMRSAALAAREGLTRVDVRGDPLLIAAARGRVEAAQVALDHARRELARHALRSPVDGRFAAPRIESRIGQVLAEGEEVGRVVSGNTIVAEIQLDPSDAALVSVGAAVVARARVLAGQPSGKVTVVSSSVETEQDGRRVLPVRATLQGSEPLAVVDLPATVEIEADGTSLLGSVLRRFVGWVRLRVVPALLG